MTHELPHRREPIADDPWRMPHDSVGHLPIHHQNAVAVTLYLLLDQDAGSVGACPSNGDSEPMLSSHIRRYTRSSTGIRGWFDNERRSGRSEHLQRFLKLANPDDDVMRNRDTRSSKYTGD